MTTRRANSDDMSILVLIMVILITVGALPAWPYSFNWGYGPNGAMSLVFLGLVILLRLDDQFFWDAGC